LGHRSKAARTLLLGWEVSEGDMTGGGARTEQTCAVCGGSGKVVFEISFCFYGKWVQTPVCLFGCGLS